MRFYSLLVLLIVTLIEFQQHVNALPASSSSSQVLDCAIVGGGPSGCAAAISLLRASPFTSLAVFEKDEFQPKGASIRISKRGWKALKQLDPAILPKLKQTYVPVTSVETKSWKQADTDEESAPPGLIKRILTKILMFLVTRAIKVHLWHDVRTVLKDHAVECSDSRTQSTNNEKILPFLNSNCLLKAVRTLEPPGGDDEARFELTFQKGSKTFQVQTKFLIACDGTKSNVRSLLPNEPDVLIPEHKSVWRGLAPTIDVNGRATFFRAQQTLGETAGRSALIFPAGQNAGASWSLISDLHDGKSTNKEQAKERALKVIETMGESSASAMMREVIEASNFVIESKLNVRDFDQPWEAAYDGLLFLGDAAHPVRPTGEGMALAFEDASVLCQVIAGSSDKRLTVETMRTFENERYLPIKTICDEIRKGAQSYYAESKK